MYKNVILSVKSKLKLCVFFRQIKIFLFFRIFEIQSSGRTNQLRVMYRTQTSIQAVETLDVTLADNQWHKLAITVSGNQLHVFLDCQ